jgi:cytochrome c553
MKKLILTLAVISMFVGGAALADVPLNNKHKGKKKGDEIVNCAYCHAKAGVPKAGKDYAKYKANESCKGAGCH